MPVWNGKWHVNPNTGETGKCYANIKPCPLGGENHYTNEHDATRAAEAIKKQLAGGTPGCLSRKEQLLGAEQYHVIPEPLRPLPQDWNDMINSLDAWHEVTEANGMGDLIDEEKLMKPWTRTYMGQPIDPDSGPINPDEEYTRCEESLAELKDLYDKMNRQFMFKDKDQRITSYAACRNLARWGRQLNDEAMWYKAHGAVSSYVQPENWYVRQQREAKEKWEREHPGQEYDSRPKEDYVPPLYYDNELKRTSTAFQVAEEACVMQGRPREDVRPLAGKILAQRNAAIDAEAQRIQAEDPSIPMDVARSMAEESEAVKQAYTRAMNYAYIERPMTDEPVTLIDIEATGLNEAGIYIQDAGWCTMRLNDPETKLSEGQVRRYGEGKVLDEVGNPTFGITGITTEELKGLKPLTDDPEAQAELLSVLKEHPFMAHNARYEDSNFTAELAGYAEAKRAGEIRIIDSVHAARRLDRLMDRPVPDKADHYGSNALEHYSKRWGAVSPNQRERHLGLEDAQIMGVAFGRHMQTLYARLNHQPDPVFTSGFVDTHRPIDLDNYNNMG